MVFIPVKQRITFNFRGTIITTDKRTFLSHAGSFLASLDSNSPYYDKAKNEFFFDRNPALFHHVLDYFHEQKMHLPTCVCPRKMKEELEFWGVPIAAIDKCCWKTFYQVDGEMAVLDQLFEAFPCVTSTIPEDSPETNNNSLKEILSGRCDTKNNNIASQRTSRKTKIWKFLNDPESSKLAKVVIDLYSDTCNDYFIYS